MVATAFLKRSNHHSVWIQDAVSLRISLHREFCGLRTGHAYPPGQVLPQLEKQMAEQPGSLTQGVRRQIVMLNVLGCLRPRIPEHAGELPRGNTSLKSTLKDIGPRGCL